MALNSEFLWVKMIYSEGDDYSEMLSTQIKIILYFFFYLAATSKGVCV